MSANPLLLPRLGLRDAKRLSRALQQELAQHRPSTLAQSQALIARLPLPTPPTAAPDLYATSSVSQLVELLGRRLSQTSDPGSAVWTRRALSLLTVVLAALVWQRDHQGLLLSEQVVLDHLDLPAMMIQSRRADLPQDLRQGLLTYLRSLPGFKEGAPHQSETTLELHAYLVMSFHPRPVTQHLSPPIVQAGPNDDVSSPQEPLLIEGSPPSRAVELGQVMANKSLLSRLTRTTPPSLSWTNRGLLHHGVLFGCCGSGQTETVTSLAINAIFQDLGVTLINAHGHTSLPSRMLALVQAHAPEALDRVRVINMTSAPGEPSLTHTFNPFAQGPVSQHVELLMDALSVPHALDDLPPGYEELLISLLSGVLSILVYGRQQKLWHLDLPFIVEHLRWSQLEGLVHIPHLPAHVKIGLKYFLDRLAALVPDRSLAQAYAPLESVLVDQLLGRVSDRYHHVLAAPLESGKWQHPQVTPADMIEQRLVTIVALPALERCPEFNWVAARLITSALSAEVVNQAQRAPTSVARHLVLAQHAALYLSRRSGSQFLRFGRKAGVGCLLTAADYPQLKTIPGLAEDVGLCNTKIFMRPCHDQAHEHATQLAGSLAPSKHALTELTEGQAHVLAGQTLYRTQMSYHAPPAGPLPDLPRCVPAWHSLGNQFTPGQVDPVRMTRVLHERLTRAPDRLPLSWCQETVARMLGYAHWHELNA